MTRPTHCLDCARPLVPNHYRGEPPPGHARHVARGLCANHYVQRTYRRTLDDLPRLTHTRADVIEDVTWLITTGTTTREVIAARLDMTWPAIAQACYRARRADLIRATRTRARSTPGRPVRRRHPGLPDHGRPDPTPSERDPVVTPDDIRALADQIETDPRYGPTARHVAAAAILRGLATRRERDAPTCHGPLTEPGQYCADCGAINPGDT